ncbi:MAG: hypothetical protein HQK91_06570 [Nitrospirae bacterium]|nr:hypothetical protein [Nitrospirota bacterium]
MAAFDEVTESESLELMSLINRVDNYLVTRKTRTLLRTEIADAFNDIGFTQDRYSLLIKQLEEINNEIAIKNPILMDLKTKLSVLEPQLKTAEHDYINLKKMQDEIETKKGVIEEKKTQVNLIKTENENLSLILDKVNKEYNDALNKKKEIDVEKNAFIQRKEGLIEDIQVMKNTDDLLRGLIPDGLSADVMSGVVNNIEVIVKKYMGEIEFTIETIEQEISRKRFEIENKDSEKQQLLEEQEELLSEIEALEPYRLSDDQKEEVLSEINQLREKAEEISITNEKKELDFQRIEYELMGVEENLKAEKDFETLYFDRYTYMSQLKQDISKIRDVNAEINRLKDETRLLKVKEDLNKKAFDETAAIKEEADNVSKSLSLRIEEYKEIFDGLDGILKG